MADRSRDWLDQVWRDLEQARNRPARTDTNEWACFAAHPPGRRKALKALNLARAQQAWGHTLTRLWVAVPQPDALKPVPPADLQNRLRILDGNDIHTRYPDSDPESTPAGDLGRRQNQQIIEPSSMRFGAGLKSNGDHTPICSAWACSVPMGGVMAGEQWQFSTPRVTDHWHGLPVASRLR